MGQASTIGSGKDVVSFLKIQHEQIKTMFDQVLAAAGEEREALFVNLRRLMAVHETAEEEIVHPAAKKSIPGGEQIVAARLAEETEAKKVLIELEASDVRQPAWEAKFRSLRDAVIAHAEAEETEELARLGEILDVQRLEKMGKAAELAEKVAPTRPHPSMESQAGNYLAGPFAAMVDRVRDAITSPAAGNMKH